MFDLKKKTDALEEKKEVKETPKTKKVAVVEPAVLATDLSFVLKAPRITEKATDSIANSNAYVFDVSPRANKVLIAQAVKARYGVTPIKVNIVPVPSKKVFSRGKRGVKSGGKKAYVYLKKGDKIELV